MNNAGLIEYISKAKKAKKPEKKSEGRPWGNFQQFTENIYSTVKIITVDPGQKISLQFHRERDEFWKILSGECVVRIDDEIFQARKGDEFFIPKEIIHRIETIYSSVEILEISSGEFDEDDIVRVKDEYGRA